jgi:cell division protein FtsB
MSRNLIKLKEGFQIILIVLMLLMLAYIVFNGYERLGRSNAVLTGERAALDRETAEYEQVLKERKNMTSDAFYEMVLRRELGLVRPDEIVFRIIYLDSMVN